MTELEKALAGEAFSRRDPEVAAFQMKVKEMLYEFNSLKPSDPQRTEIIKNLVTGYNQYVFIEDGFHGVNLLGSATDVIVLEINAAGNVIGRTVLIAADAEGVVLVSVTRECSGC